MKQLELFDYSICPYCKIYYESKKCPNCVHSEAHNPFHLLWRGIGPKKAKEQIGSGKSYEVLLYKKHRPELYKFLVYKSSFKLSEECFYVEENY